MRPDPKSPKVMEHMESWSQFLEVLQDRLVQVYLPRAGHRKSPLLSPEQGVCLQVDGEIGWVLLGQVYSGDGRDAWKVPCSDRETISQTLALTARLAAKLYHFQNKIHFLPQFIKVSVYPASQLTLGGEEAALPDAWRLQTVGFVSETKFSLFANVSRDARGVVCKASKQRCCKQALPRCLLLPCVLGRLVAGVGSPWTAQL